MVRILRLARLWRIEAWPRRLCSRRSEAIIQLISNNIRLLDDVS